MASKYKDTCTACAGTMVLEFAALSRLTGDPIFEVIHFKAGDNYLIVFCSRSDYFVRVLLLENLQINL
jgi:hypothetical protein